MIARLNNVQRIFDEVTSQGFDCVNVCNADGKASFGQRTAITPDEVCDFIRKTHGDFAGEYMVEVWSTKVKGVRCKYVLNGQANGNGQMNGNGSMNGDVMRLMQANFDTRLELEKLRIAGVDKVDYMPQAIQMLGQLLTNKGAQPAPAPTPTQPVNGADDEGTEDPEEPDVFDEYAEADPEAYDVIARILKLKRDNPALYEQTKGSLKSMTG